MHLHLAQPDDWLAAFQDERRFLAGAESRWLTRYTPVALDVIRSAGKQARGMRCNHVGAEHLLLGLLEIPSRLASTILYGVGLTHPAVRAAVLADLGTKGIFYDGMSIPFTPRLKQVCLTAQAAAQSRADSRVDPEDLLHALLGEVDGLSHGLFKRFEVDTLSLQARLRTPTEV